MEIGTPRQDVVGYDPDPLYAYAYVSAPTAPFSAADLTDLLLSARRFNGLHAVTGKLVVLEDGDRVARFAQWVEGPRAGVAAVVARIHADPRHGGIEVRRAGAVLGRRFPGWEMVYAPVAEARFEPEAEALVEG